MSETKKEEQFDESRRVDWRTMSMKLVDAMIGLLRKPDGASERSWAEKMLFRVREMTHNEARSKAGAPGCELCGEQDRLVLHSRCHFTAPLQLVRDGEELIARCYLPDCNREVARFRIAQGGTR